jgi:hypothetical protein
MTGREVCSRCDRESPVGFSVHDDVWNAVTASSTDVLCIFCFDELATEQGIAWDRLVMLWPVSGVTAREAVSESSHGANTAPDVLH